MFDIVSPDYDHSAARDFFKNSVHASINYLIDFYELTNVGKSPALSWQMCAAHYLAAKCAEADDHENAIVYLRYMESIPSANQIVISPLTSTEASFDKEMILKIIRDDKELGFGFCDDLSLAQKESVKIEKALKTIRQYVPQAWNEIRSYINAVYLTRETHDGSRFMRSGTNFYMWGMIFAYVHEEHTVPYYIDILTHECGHTALNILNSFDELVLNNPEETFQAPLRNDQRPMIGIFHAFFVLSRICYVLEKIVRKGTSEYVDECRERFISAYKKLTETYQTIKQHAQFTDLGRSVYNDICKRWELVG